MGRYRRRTRRRPSARPGLPSASRPRPATRFWSAKQLLDGSRSGDLSASQFGQLVAQQVEPRIAILRGGRERFELASHAAVAFMEGRHGIEQSRLGPGARRASLAGCRGSPAAEIPAGRGFR